MASITMTGQNALSWDEFVEYVTLHAEQSSSEDEQTDNEAWIEHLEELQQIHLSPININTATKTDLLAIPFLSEPQVNEIRDYIEKYHGMRTLYELILIRSLHGFERQILPLFVYAGTTNEFMPKSITLKEMLAQQKHELTTRIDIPLYHRKGYLVKNGYRGARYYNRAHYTFSATQHIQASIHMERDAGEKGIDSYGGQLMLKDFGHLETLVIGDFKTGFGEGLVLNQGFSMGKSSLLSRPSQGIKAHKGYDEHNYLRGIGAMFRWNDLHISAFASHRKWDATLSGDSAITTILTSGYHRTSSEWKKKGNIHVDVMGADLTWRHKEWYAGTTGYFLHTSLPLKPGTSPYRQIYPEGSLFGVAGIHYGYSTYRWSVRGETAYSTDQGGLATLNTASWQFNSRYRISASQRYYNYHYYSFFASALSENTKVQNETGATLRLDATPMDGMQLSAYADYFYNPWPRYGLKQSSQGFEVSTSAQQTLNRRNKINVLYSFKNKEYSSGIQNHHRLRIQWHYQPSNLIKWQTSAMLHALENSCGIAIGETFRFAQGTSRPLHFSVSGIYFHTNDYNSRIYLYEPNVRGTLSIPSFYGHGIRFSGTLQYTFWHNRLSLELKYGITDYFDRSIQSSSLQTIYSRYKNDVNLQLRFKI